MEALSDQPMGKQGNYLQISDSRLADRKCGQEVFFTSNFTADSEHSPLS